MDLYNNPRAENALVMQAQLVLRNPKAGSEEIKEVINSLVTLTVGPGQLGTL